MLATNTQTQVLASYILPAFTKVSPPAMTQRGFDAQPQSQDEQGEILTLLPTIEW